MQVYSVEEIRKHNSKESAWVVVNNKVYDVTGFLLEHPGGEDILVESSGSDATVAFISTGHSEDARELMKNFEIGTTKEKKPLRHMDSIKFDHSKQEKPDGPSLLVPALFGMLLTSAIWYFMQM